MKSVHTNWYVHLLKFTQTTQNIFILFFSNQKLNKRLIQQLSNIYDQGTHFSAKNQNWNSALESKMQRPGSLVHD